jgi:uncharacterized protein (DUF2141 family)
MNSLMLLLMAIGSLAPAAAAAATVTIDVTGAKQSGKVFGQIFGDAATFKARTSPVQRFAIDPAGPAVLTTISLPPGRYAIAMFQDTKGTGKLETNMFGVPQVPYGFSNNARGTLGPPSFDSASFVVGVAAVALSIELH